MALFWSLAAILIIAAMAFIWSPIFSHRRSQKADNAPSVEELNVQAYRSRIEELDADFAEGRIEEEEFNSLKSELERNLLTDTQAEPAAGDAAVLAAKAKKGNGFWLGAVVTVLTVAVTLGLYWQLGSIQTVVKAKEFQAASERMTQLPLAERIKELERLAQASPSNADLWYSLAQGYIQTNQFDKADDAYNRVLVLVGEEPQVIAEYAQTLFFKAGNRLTEKAKALVDRVLAVDPENTTALGLLGIDAFNQERYVDAIGYWQQLLEGTADEQAAEAIQSGIARARMLLADQQGQSQPESEKPGASIEIEVSLSSALASKSAPEQAVFVFAKAVNGPPMPLAAAKLRVQDLPTKVVLNDEMAMTPQAKLSQFEQVQVIARVSQAESVISAAGDLQGESGPISLGKSPTKIKIVIDNVVE